MKPKRAQQRKRYKEVPKTVMLHVSVDPTTTQVFKHITLVRIILYIVYVLTFQVVMQSEM